MFMARAVPQLVQYAALTGFSHMLQDFGSAGAMRICGSASFSSPHMLQKAA